VHCVQVLPALKEHHAEFLLKELYKRWGNHKIMVRWLSRFFNYLDRRVPRPWYFLHGSRQCTHQLTSLKQSPVHYAC
jgi:hypothetical protein